MTNKNYTPDKITSLSKNEIFVFGSNLEGKHYGGAARIAVKSFGAIMGQGVGLQGKCYAIPTMHGGVNDIKPYVDQFISFAKSRKDLIFLVTRIGCGIAGFKEEQIAPLFADAYNESNILLPKSFADIISNTLSPIEHYSDIESFKAKTIYQTPAGWFYNIHNPYDGEVDNEIKGKVVARSTYEDDDFYPINDGFFCSILVITQNQKKALFTIYKYHGMQGVCYKSISSLPYKYDDIKVFSDLKKWWNIGFACCRHHGKWDLLKITQVNINAKDITRIEVLGLDFSSFEQAKSIIDKHPKNSHYTDRQE